MPNSIILNGGNLTIEKLEQIIYGKNKVEISAKCLELVKKSRTYLEDQAKKEIIYGVNTGFGPMADYVIGVKQEAELQQNLIRSHAVGVGEPLAIDEVKTAMIIRLNTLISGYSGVRVDIIDRMKLYINKNIIPIVPQHGSVGASGDLVQLAHIALAIIGEGNVWYKDKKQKTKSVLKELGLKPIILGAKEGLSLINGTSVMTAIGSLLCLEAKRIYQLVIAASAMGLEIIDGFNDAFSRKLQELRPHPGQIKVAADIRKKILGCNLITTRKQLQKEIIMDNSDVKKIDRKVQDYYSFRCLPQILGPVYDTICNTIKVIETEINSVTENPVIDFEHDTIIHGGNFHGDYVSLEMDKLKIAMTRVAMLIERRINFFMHDKINNSFPPFLNIKKPGLTLGLQALQFTATSTTAECQSLCFPNYIHSIPCNADNQDIVSMGTNSALLAKKVIENLWEIMMIDFITLTQAVDCLKIKSHLTEDVEKIYNQIRLNFKTIINDREVTDELPQLLEFIKKKLKSTVKF